MNTAAIKLIVITMCYAIVYLYFDNLSFDIRKDEVHFWRTSLLFSKSFFPDLNLLRSYNELNTPLPFMLFGIIEKLFNSGIYGGRLFNFLLSYVMSVLVVLGNRQAYLNTFFLLLFPYFLATSTHLYTDIIASFFVLIALIFFLQKRYVLSSTAFILAISSRQYMLAFAAGTLLFSFARQEHRNADAIIPLSISCLSIFAWFLVFNGFAPPVAVKSQSILTASIPYLRIENMLYFASCVGIYYVLPEIFIEKKDNNFFHKITLQYLSCFVALAVLFILAPPLKNINYNVVSMGYFDLACRYFLPDPLRMTVFFIFAYLAVVRFFDLSLPSLLFFCNCLMMMKAHIGWDKYILPLVICLWYLRSNHDEMSIMGDSLEESSLDKNCKPTSSVLQGAS